MGVRRRLASPGIECSGRAWWSMLRLREIVQHTAVVAPALQAAAGQAAGAALSCQGSSRLGRGVQSLLEQDLSSGLAGSRLCQPQVCRLSAGVRLFGSWVCGLNV